MLLFSSNRGVGANPLTDPNLGGVSNFVPDGQNNLWAFGLQRHTLSVTSETYPVVFDQHDSLRGSSASGRYILGGIRYYFLLSLSLSRSKKKRQRPYTELFSPPASQARCDAPSLCVCDSNAAMAERMFMIRMTAAPSFMSCARIATS